MAFFNMQEGDAPFFKSLADTYTMSDNYHQPVLGGTGPDSQPLGFADQLFFSDGLAIPRRPRRPISIIPIRRLEHSTSIPRAHNGSIVPIRASPALPRSRII